MIPISMPTIMPESAGMVKRERHDLPLHPDYPIMAPRPLRRPRQISGGFLDMAVDTEEAAHTMLQAAPAREEYLDLA